MFNLVIAISCSVLVSIFLKIARKQKIYIAQAIAFNYVAAMILCYFLLHPNLSATNLKHSLIDGGYSYLFLLLGILLPTIFLVMSRAVEYAGIVRSDAAQRLSLFLPVVAAFTLFGEAFSLTRGVSVLLAFTALFCLLWKNDTNALIAQNKKKGSLALLLVWLGFGTIDILLKQVSKLGSALSLTLFIIFAIAACVMFSYLQIMQIAKGLRWDRKSMLAGLFLGCLNFMNIWFYLQAHRAFKDNPTLVFAAMNVGVICIGTLVGAGLFKEKMNKANVIGVLLGISAILSLFYLDKLLA